MLRRAEWTVLPVSHATCHRLVWDHHYSKSLSCASTYRHGLFARAEPHRCVGVAQWFPPIRSAAIASWDGDWHEVLALSRLAIAPDVPTNAASFLLAASVRLIKDDGRYRCLITYADTWRGHTGAIYRAANWEYMGMTQPNGRWVDSAGMLVSFYRHGHGRTRTEMESQGFRHAGDFPTHKYRLILPPARARRTLFDQRGA